MKATKKAVCYKRGQRKPERIAIREYTCEIGDRVLCQGKEILVQEVIEDGSEARRKRAFIKGCPIHSDGTPLVRLNVYAGQDWGHTARNKRLASAVSV